MSGVFKVEYSDQPASGKLVSISAANYDHHTGLALEGIAARFCTGLGTSTVMAGSVPLPTSLGSTTVKVKDGAEVEYLAPLFFVSPSQVNYQISATRLMAWHR